MRPHRQWLFIVVSRTLCKYRFHASHKITSQFINHEACQIRVNLTSLELNHDHFSSMSSRNFRLSGGSYWTACYNFKRLCTLPHCDNVISWTICSLWYSYNNAQDTWCIIFRRKILYTTWGHWIKQSAMLHNQLFKPANRYITKARMHFISNTHGFWNQLMCISDRLSVVQRRLGHAIGIVFFTQIPWHDMNVLDNWQLAALFQSWCSDFDPASLDLRQFVCAFVVYMHFLCQSIRIKPTNI